MPLGSGATANHGVSYNESGVRGTPAGVVTSYRSNIIWWFSPKPTNHFWKAGAKFAPGDNIADPSLVTNNTCWNCGVANQPGKTSDGTYYDLPTTGFAPGANDINLDPGFVDPTRNFETAGQILWGADGTIAGTLQALKTDPATRIPELIQWIKAGFAPTNPALATAAHDGTYSGAVSVVSAAAATQCSGVGTNAMSTLAPRHDTADIALEQARALVNASTVEADPRQREVIADRIGELRSRHDTADIALEQARALVNAATVEADPRQREVIADRIGELRSRHDTADIALEQARALVNASAVEPDPKQREVLADRIRELQARHDTADIALEQTRALVNASAVASDLQQIKALAGRIGELREHHDTADIALEHAKALVIAIVGEPDPKQREALADDIRELLARHDLQSAVNAK